MSTPKVILVTGASSGFGAMTVRAWHRTRVKRSQPI